MGRRLNIQPGMRFGRLVVIEELEPTIGKAGTRIRQFVFRCDCGREATPNIYHVVRGHTRSCGCLYRKRSGGVTKQPLYRVWRAMKMRCLTKSHPGYRNYGARGVTVCDEWLHDSNAFIEWALQHGWRSGLQIDRTDNNGDYSPSNCRFVRPETNSRNKRETVIMTYCGETMPVIDWADKIGISYPTLLARHRRGWSPEETLTTPVTKANRWYRRRVADVTAEPLRAADATNG